MAELASVATALPPHVVTLAETQVELGRHVGDRAAAARFRDMAGHSGIAERRLVIPLRDVVRLQTIEDRQREYLRHAVALGETVSREALVRARVTPAEVDAVISVSCTGYMMPSLEVHLGRRLHLNPAARRIPLTELGCSAAVAALGLASDLLAPAAERRSVLVVSTELSSLSVQTVEPGVSDVMGGILFGDGAAAAVLTGDARGRGLRVVGSGTLLLPETGSDLGMRLTTTGFRLELSRHVPRLITRHLRSAATGFLADRGLALGDVAFWALHPGGPRIMAAIADALGLSDAALRPTLDVWRRCGNVSSTTVLLVLREILDRHPPAPNALGILLATGPGLSFEMALLRAPAAGAPSC